MKRLQQRTAVHRGFTLIEVMITVAIVAILAAVAYPSYRDYIIRGRLVDATNGLSSMRAEMERHFQDNRTYGTVGAFISPCADAAPVASRTFGDFVVTCAIVNANAATGVQPSYVLTATGSGPTANFVFTVNQVEARATTGAPNGWNTGACWLVRRGQTC